LYLQIRHITRMRSAVHIYPNMVKRFWKSMADMRNMPLREALRGPTANRQTNQQTRTFQYGSVVGGLRRAERRV